MRRRQAAGFTVIEILVAIAVAAAGFTALWTVLLGMARTDRAAAEQAADAGAAAVALEALQRDLRQVIAVEESRPGFLRARTGEEWISWRLEGGRVVRNAGGRDRALGRNVAGFVVRERGRLLEVTLHGEAREGGRVPAWSASAAAARRMEGER